MWANERFVLFYLRAPISSPIFLISSEMAKEFVYLTYFACSFETIFAPYTKTLKTMRKMEDCILILRTSIVRKQDVKRVGVLLAQYPQIHRWNVDFEDWEKVLRIECLGMSPAEISDALRTINICARELE